MKVLFIAPEVEGLPSLNTWEELDRIGDMPNVSLEVLAGKDVTRSRVANRLSRNYDVIILAGHGKPGKFIVADGCLTANWLARYIRGATPQVVLLSACRCAEHSISTLTSLAEEISATGVPVIAMYSDVDDDAAVIYDIEFMRAYSDGATIREAHQIALEQMETKTNPGQMPLYMPGANANIAGSLGRIEEGFESLAVQIDRMETNFNEQRNDIVHRVDRIWGEQGHLAKRMGQLESRVEELGEAINGGRLRFDRGGLTGVDATQVA